MTIEIADRLVKLRKKYGYSQEELADKLGLSRQAVSKWERAEASPDTDNLICLAKLYGVSLDELLSTDEDIDTIVNEQVKDAASKEENDESETVVRDGGDEVRIGKDGIYVKDEDGSTVVIGNGCVECKDVNGNVVKNITNKKAEAVIGSIEGALHIAAAIVYILLGTLLGMWHNGWVVFFAPEIICSTIRCIVFKDAGKLNVPFISCFVFFFVCMIAPGLSANLWHPMWVVFLAIPLYYTIVGSIKKGIHVVIK